MSQREKSACFVKELEFAFRCPICESPVRVVDFKSVICHKKHTFDFAKQGYLNLMTRPVVSRYNKELFTARRHIIMESDLYTSMHERIIQVIRDYQESHSHPLIMADLGCGEGSHLQQILEECDKFKGVGLDISRDGIFLASRSYGQAIWLVGDLAKLPFMDHSVHVILNILSPSNYKEFKRVLTRDGLVVKVVPQSDYLRELRDLIFDHDRDKEYTNAETVSLFLEHFHLLDKIPLRYSQHMKKEELQNLVLMTPLHWSSDPNRAIEFTKKASAEITIDLTILIGVHKG